MVMKVIPMAKTMAVNEKLWKAGILIVCGGYKF